MQDGAVLSIEGIAFSVGRRELFSGISLQLRMGDLILITGPNGSGKSTLLRCLAGLQRPDRGKVVRHCDEMCYIGHKLGLNATLTATENLRYLSGYSASPIALEKALKQFHLNRFADQLVLNLSAGQKKRVALSHLVSNPSRLWLLDEPFASLDADSAQRFNELLLHRTQHSEGATVLVSHERQALPFSSTIEMDDS